MRLIVAAVVAAKSRGGAAVRTPSTWVCRHCGAVNARTALVCRNRC